MNTTKKYGFIRRIDELGRIVLPSDLRRDLRIQEGDPLEIARTDDGFYIQKYQPLQTLDSLCKQYLSVLAKHCGVACAICNTDYVIASKGIQLSTEQFMSESVMNKIRYQEAYHYSVETRICLYDDGTYPIDTLYPIGTKDNPLGAVIMLHYRNTTSEEKCCANMIADLLTELTKNE